MTKFVKNGANFHLSANAGLSVTDKLPAGTYTINIAPITEELYLAPIEPFSLGKIYGDVGSKSERILNTFLSRKSSTGVLLAGEKGCGKTMLAKLLSIDGLKNDIPTIVVNRPLHGEDFNQFIQSIDQPCIIMFDEFEKVYNDEEHQEALLTLLDGVYPTQKMFILTTNDVNGINQHMINRPGRLFYSLYYEGLDEVFVREYCKDNLLNQDHTEGLVMVSSVFEHFNFDMLKALVEEMNRYNETAKEAVQMMNIRPSISDGLFEVKIEISGKECITDTYNDIDPSDAFNIYYYKNEADQKAGRQLRVLFYPDNCVSIKRGNYVYRKDNITVYLTKKKYAAFTF